MLHRLRLAVLCLLALALPVQGFAAATMLLCTAHHAVAEHQQALGLTLDQAVDVHPAHQDQAPADTAAKAGPHPDCEQTSATSQADTKKCAACATCCAAVAFPATATVLVALAAAVPVLERVDTPPLWFLTDGQDRPPRPFLA